MRHRPGLCAHRAPRLLVLRSGRHLRVAIDALRAYAPGCEIAVVGTPGSEAAIAQAGVPAEHRFIYSARPRFLPLAFVCSDTARHAGRWQYDRVVVLWNDPAGNGQGNVNRTALVLSPRGFLAVAPDGSIVERALWPQLRAEALRAVASVATGAAISALLYLPASIAWLVARTMGVTGGGRAQ